MTASLKVLVKLVALQTTLLWSCYGFVMKKSDDVDIITLKNIVEQQAAKIVTLESEMVALKNMLPGSFQQVAFTVRFSADEARNGIPITSGQTLKFDTVMTNLGSAYQTLTGVFTAPVSGLYAFFLVAMSPDNAPPLMLAIVKNGVYLDIVYGNGSTDPDDQGSTQITVHLVAGDMVWIQQVQGTGVRGANWTVFTGYLLVADKPA